MPRYFYSLISCQTLVILLLFIPLDLYRIIRRFLTVLYNRPRLVRIQSLSFYCHYSQHPIRNNMPQSQIMVTISGKSTTHVRSMAKYGIKLANLPFGGGEEVLDKHVNR